MSDALVGASAMTRRVMFSFVVICLAAGLGLVAQTPPAAPPPGGAPIEAANLGADFSPKAPMQARTPEEQLKTFLLPAGYRLELVASDPDINNPAVIEWDGNGRMYVSEFRSYMIDADATNEHDAINRISRWEDTNADGTYDTHTVFADRLFFPRMILPIDNNCILTNETHSDDVIRLCDTNDDGVSDTKTVWYTGVGRGRDGNVEHEQSGFVWGLDNWIYSTYNAFRFRWTPRGIQREPTAPNGASWGLTQDDDGKPWFINAGGERGPVNFQFPIQYGALTLDDGFEPEFQTVWPAPGIADMQGGMRRVRAPIGALNHFTATAGADVVRAHRVPSDLQGDLLITEPVGRLVRRARIVKREGLTQLQNANPGSEFILSADPLFRPVNIKTAPDGSIYIADMYHGIIQEAQWVPRGSYLRTKVEQYQLDKVNSYGRIWRLRYDGTPASPPSLATPVPATSAIDLDRTSPRMLGETPAQLVRHLTHENGWWRDTAQRLLVLKQDQSVVAALQAMARSSDSLVGRFHALWTLEGLGALDAALVRQALTDPNPRMRVQGLRASESLYKAGDRSFAADYATAATDADSDVSIQALLTVNTLKVGDSKTTINAAMAASKARGVLEVGKFLLNPPATAATAATLSPDHQQQMARGETIYRELCFECHGDDGRGAPLAGAAPGTTMAPAIAGSPRVMAHRDYVIKTLLHGLTGPVDGKAFVQVMIPMGQQSDQWLADVGSYVRNAFGNTGSFVAPSDVAHVRATTKNRSTLWTADEISRTLPIDLQAQPDWKVTASHNQTEAASGLTLRGWTSAAPQEAGMWFQVELPEPMLIAEVQFDAAGGGVLGSVGRGGLRGRGAAPAPAPAPTPPNFGFARQYEVRVSMDGQTWSAPVARGGGSPLTIAAFTPVRAKFVRIIQTAAPAPGVPAWVIQNLRVFRAPSAVATR